MNEKPRIRITEGLITDQHVQGFESWLADLHEQGYRVVSSTLSGDRMACVLELQERPKAEYPPELRQLCDADENSDDYMKVEVSARDEGEDGAWFEARNGDDFTIVKYRLPKLKAHHEHIGKIIAYLESQETEAIGTKGG